MGKSASVTSFLYHDALPLVDPESTEQRTMHQNLGSCDPKQTLSEAVWSQLLRSDVKPLLWVLTAALDPLVRNRWDLRCLPLSLATFHRGMLSSSSPCRFACLRLAVLLLRLWRSGHPSDDSLCLLWLQKGRPASNPGLGLGKFLISALLHTLVFVALKYCTNSSDWARESPWDLVSRWSCP